MPQWRPPEVESRVTIVGSRGAGAAGGHFVSFLAAIALSRGLRYFGLAVLAQIVGPRIARAGVPRRVLIPAMIALLAAIWAVVQLL